MPDPQIGNQIANKKGGSHGQPRKTKKSFCLPKGESCWPANSCIIPSFWGNGTGYSRDLVGNNHR